jgi:hypothetical protein
MVLNGFQRFPWNVERSQHDNENNFANEISLDNISELAWYTSNTNSGDIQPYTKKDKHLKVQKLFLLIKCLSWWKPQLYDLIDELPYSPIGLGRVWWGRQTIYHVDCSRRSDLLNSDQRMYELWTCSLASIRRSKRWRGQNLTDVIL